MIIKLIFDQSNAPASFTSAVESAALMLEKAITDPITVTIEVGYGRFPTDNSLITNGAAEGEPADGSSSSASSKMSGAHLSTDCEKRSVKYGNRTGAMATRWPKDCRASGIRKKQLTH